MDERRVDLDESEEEDGALGGAEKVGAKERERLSQAQAQAAVETTYERTNEQKRRDLHRQALKLALAAPAAMGGTMQPWRGV